LSIISHNILIRTFSSEFFDLFLVAFLDDYVQGGCANGSSEVAVLFTAARNYPARTHAYELRDRPHVTILSSVPTLPGYPMPAR